LLREFNKEFYNADVLVIGGGGAAARAALAARERGSSVRLVCKGKTLGSGSTASAVSELLGIGAALGYTDRRDKPEVHYHDTLEAATGFVDPKLVKVFANDAPKRLKELNEWGVPFVRRGNRLAQRLSDFATYPRTCWVENGETGRAILNILVKKLKQQRIPIDENIMIFQLLVEDGKIFGALGIEIQSNKLLIYRVKSIVLATGGAQEMYKYNVSTKEMTGDGYAMALRVGLPLINMEFIQFGLAVIGSNMIALSGPLYRLHPRILDAQKKEFLNKYIPKNVDETEVFKYKIFPFTSNNVSKYLDIGIFSEIMAGRGTQQGGVFFDFRECAKEMKKRTPVTMKLLSEHDINPGEDLLEVSIAAQCMNGGVMMTGSNGETDIVGLYVAGEVAGGLRGPDRPGGNALTEGQVFGYRAGLAAAENSFAKENVLFRSVENRIEEVLGNLSNSGVSHDFDLFKRQIQEIMWEKCLVKRNQQGLDNAFQSLQRIKEQLITCRIEELIEFLSIRNMILTAQAVILSARKRRESRSTHYRSDFPCKGDNKWIKCFVVKLSQGDFKIFDHKWV